MKQIGKIAGLLALVVLVACGPKRERFNYTMIKSKLALSDEQTRQFDEITGEYLKKARKVVDSNLGDKVARQKAVKAIFTEQDELLKALLSAEQYAIYAHEISIERQGREKYNTTIIRDQLGLDSLQVVKYNQANEAFYTTLHDNHDNYHGKPKVYEQYYQQIDKHRLVAFQQLMTDEQYVQYLKLAEHYKLGQSEH